MNTESFREYCLSFDGVTEKMPFGKFSARYDSILAFYVLDHMFCFIDINDFHFVNVKSTPDVIEELRLHHASISNPVNRSLKYWIQLNFDGDIPPSLIFELVEKAYNLVKTQYTPKRQTKYCLR